MNDIRIRHCRLRVLRHGGWSWGADPRQLVEQVTRKLPEWLMQALANQFADCPPGVTIERLRLRIPLKLSELCELRTDSGADTAAVARDGLADCVRTQLSAALRDVPLSRYEVPAGSARPAPQLPTAEASPSVVLDLLLAWQRAQQLPRMLGTADAETVRTWVRAALEELPIIRPRGPAVAAVAAQAARLELLTAGPAADAVSLREELSLMLAMLVAPPEETGLARSEAAAVRATAAAPDAAGAEIARARAPAQLAISQTTRAAREPRRALPKVQARRDPVTVESVLPFVVVGILARRGYLQTLTATLACAGLLEQSCCFATALAYKLSPPPHRGWDRGLATRRLAAAMCGAEEAPDNVAMERFLRALSTASAPLDASLWPADRAMRRRPGILVEKLADGTWVALDIASSLPLGWFATSEALLKLADLLPKRLWWLASGAADSEFPAAVQQRGLRAVAMGPMPRIAAWVDAGGLLSTNEPTLRRHAAALQGIFDAAHERLIHTHTELIESRPLVVPARGSTRCAAEFSVTLALCGALGELAHGLWREREATHPLLAMQRFADLGGTVSFEEGRLLVRPVLGQRFMDLGKHGFLRDIVGVPWWPGRRVEFAGP